MSSPRSMFCISMVEIWNQPMPTRQKPDLLILVDLERELCNYGSSCQYSQNMTQVHNVMSHIMVVVVVDIVDGDD